MQNYQNYRETAENPHDLGFGLQIISFEFSHTHTHTHTHTHKIVYKKSKDIVDFIKLKISTLKDLIQKV